VPGSAGLELILPTTKKEKKKPIKLYSFVRGAPSSM
jgi:hypothetical protein